MSHVKADRYTNQIRARNPQQYKANAYLDDLFCRFNFS